MYINIYTSYKPNWLIRLNCHSSETYLHTQRHKPDITININGEWAEMGQKTNWTHKRINKKNQLRINALIFCSSMFELTAVALQWKYPSDKV